MVCPWGGDRGIAPLCGAGNEPPFSFRLHRKENGRSRSKEKALLCPKPARSGRFGRVRGLCETVSPYAESLLPGALYPWGRESVSPHLGAWERLSGVADVWPLLLFPRSSLRLALANSRLAERQRQVGESQIGFAARRTEAVRRGLHTCKFQQDHARAQRWSLPRLPKVSCWDPTYLSKPAKGGIWTQSAFLFHRARRILFSRRKREWGGASPVQGTAPI